jgi:hypothetical protein
MKPMRDIWRWDEVLAKDSRFQPFTQLVSSRSGDRVDIGYYLFTTHTNARIENRQSPCFLVSFQTNFVFVVLFQ